MELDPTCEGGTKRSLSCCICISMLFSVISLDSYAVLNLIH